MLAEVRVDVVGLLPVRRVRHQRAELRLLNLALVKRGGKMYTGAFAAMSRTHVQRRPLRADERHHRQDEK